MFYHKTMTAHRKSQLKALAPLTSLLAAAEHFSNYNCMEQAATILDEAIRQMKARKGKI